MSTKKKDGTVKSTMELEAKHEEREQMKAESQKLIRDLMKARGWTQAELAKEFAVSESTAWRWYEGKSIPIPAFLIRARKLLERSAVAQSA